MDPLAILKEFCVGGQLDQVEIEEDRIKFGDKYSFPKQSPTAFRAKVRCRNVCNLLLGLNAPR
jgi:hypothetical protein